MSLWYPLNGFFIQILTVFNIIKSQLWMLSFCYRNSSRHVRILFFVCVCSHCELHNEYDIDERHAHTV